MTDEEQDEGKPEPIDHPVLREKLDTNWREALRSTHEALDDLRRIFPGPAQILPEGASRHLRSAMRSLEDASGELHYAGRHVLGDVQYEEFLEEESANDAHQKR